MINHLDVWTTIILLGLGSFGLRFIFLGALGSSKLPDWLLRHLRYTPVAILPAMIAPMVAWPAATGGHTDLLRLVVAFTTLAIGYLSKNTIIAMAGGGILLVIGIQFLGLGTGI